LAEAHAADPTETKGPGALEHTVLLVDDDTNLLHGLTRALRRQPYQLYTAQSGDEATWVLKAHDIDVIVTDEKMPGMSGCDLLAWVAKNYPEIVRILLTGYATTESAIRAVNKGGVYQIFTKPCRDVHLAIAIRKALEQRDLLKGNLRLRELRRQAAGTAPPLNQGLETLLQLVARDLHEPLQVIADLWKSHEDGSCEAFGPNARALLETALDAAAEVERQAKSLLEDRCVEAASVAEPVGADEPYAGQLP
jgi:response regulator RpfG family c-di-GMP phosphodiesterase